jgi:hypothetical protein
MRLHRLAIVLAATAAVTASCGGGKGSPKIENEAGSTTTAQTVAPSTAPPSSATLEVKPSSVADGAVVSLTAKGLGSGEVVKFEIDMPGGKTFTGGPHTAGADGTVTANYRTAAATNPAGSYTVKVTGDKGASATAGFTITAGTTATTAKRSTSGGSTTTAKSTTTTARGATTTSTTTKQATTTTTHG